MRQVRRAGIPEGMAGSEKMLPENFVPPPSPPSSMPLNILLAGTQPFPFSTDGTAPPGKGVQGPSVLGNYQSQGGGKGNQEGSQPFPSALRKGKLRH